MKQKETDIEEIKRDRVRKKGPNGDRNKHTHTHRELKHKKILEFARSFFHLRSFLNLTSVQKVPLQKTDSTKD